MADPTPSAGLPELEYLELYNRSHSSIQLRNWKIMDASTSGCILNTFDFPPNSYLVLSEDSSGFAHSLTPDAWPRLNNGGDQIILVNAEGDTIDRVHYEVSWYGDSRKDDGGYALELIDLDSKCSGALNWKASENNLGGTPGIVNSLESVPDLLPPAIRRTYAIDSMSVILEFDEGLYGQSVKNASYDFQHDTRIEDITWDAAIPEKILIHTLDPLVSGIIYTVHLKYITDCSGNLIPDDTMIKFVIPEKADSADLVINEILFNPLPGGVDFVEIYNRSYNYIDLNNIFSFTMSDSMQIHDRLSADYHIIAPHDFAVLTENPSLLRSFHPDVVEEKIIETDLPSLPNSSGSMGISRGDQEILDLMYYDADHHFSLLRDVKGVSLERVNPDIPSSEPTNWRSASEPSGFSTPGYINSQSIRSMKNNKKNIEVIPQLITPDNDGINDYCSVRYNFRNPHMIGNVVIYDVNGIEVRKLVEQSLLGTSGAFNWDATDNHRRKVRIGAYLILFTIFDENGNRKAWQLPVAVAHQF